MSEFASVSCEHEGTLMPGFVAYPKDDGGPFPTVLLFPGATGTGPTFESRARELADLGYLAGGISVYGDDIDLTTPEAAGKAFMALLDTPEILRSRIVAWFEEVARWQDVDAQRMAAIGYCFGGKCVLELARSGADLQAVVSYHGLLTTHAPATGGSVKAEVIAYCAGRDPYAPLEHFDAFRKEMADAEVTHQVTLFSDAEHSFTDPDHDGIQPGISYDALADSVSWAGTLALLEHKLRGP